MAYALDPHEALSDGVRRVALEQVDGTLASLDEIAAHGGEEAVHDVRKRCKKVRALARLVRSEIGEETYRDTNDPVRDAARSLSASRDAQVLVEAFDDLLGAMGGDRRSHRPVWTELDRRAEEAARAVSGHDGDTAAARATFVRLRAQVRDWSVGDDLEELLDGTARVYRRGRRAHRAVLHAPTVEALHEWRKRVKYLWYHLRLLAPASPEVLGGFRDVLDELADLLGDDHDLAVLQRVLEDDADAFGGPARVAAVVEVAEARRADLQARARHLGRQVYVEKPRRFTERLAVHWSAAAAP